MKLTDLQEKYKKLNLAEKLIAIHTLVFIGVNLVAFLFQTHFITNWFALSKEVTEVLIKPWTVLSYAFLHASFGHLFFNMIMLYFVGKMFLSVFDQRLLLKVYFLGAISGALFFLLLSSLYPSFLNSSAALLGASAAVSALLIFLCASFPNQEVSVFTFKLQLWHVGFFFVVIDLIQLNGGNRGGHIAHLGGVLLGYFYAKQYANGNDIGKGFGNIIDALTNWFQNAKQPKMKTVHKTRRERNASHQTVHQKDRSHQNKVNAILEKISKSGYESLTKEEKAFLFQSGK